MKPLHDYWIFVPVVYAVRFLLGVMLGYGLHDFINEIRSGKSRGKQ